MRAFTSSALTSGRSRVTLATPLCAWMYSKRCACCWRSARSWTRMVASVVIKHGTGHLLPDTRELLLKTGKPFVIENVPGAPMRADLKLCGCMFNLTRLKRQRWFETSWNLFTLLPPCHHDEHPISVTGHGIPSGNFYMDKLRYPEYIVLAKKAMGIDWMSRDELSQAIPPAYTEFIGSFLMRELQ